MFTRPVSDPPCSLPHPPSGLHGSGSFSPCPGPRSVPWRLRAAQDRACGGDAIEPPEEVAEEGEPSERGVRSRKWTVTTHPKKELWSAILAAGLASQGHRRAERPAGGARSVSQHLDARAPQRPASRPLRACGARLGAVLTTGSAHCRSHRTTGGGLVRCLLSLRFGGWKALCALLVLMFL